MQSLRLFLFFTGVRQGGGLCFILTKFWSRLQQRRHLGLERLPSYDHATLASYLARPWGLFPPLAILHACWVTTGPTRLYGIECGEVSHAAEGSTSIKKSEHRTFPGSEGRLHGTTVLVSTSCTSDIEVKIIDSFSKAFVSVLSTTGEGPRVINSSMISCPHLRPLSVPPLVDAHPLGDRWRSTASCLGEQYVRFPTPTSMPYYGRVVFVSLDRLSHKEQPDRRSRRVGGIIPCGGNVFPALALEAYADRDSLLISPDSEVSQALSERKLSYDFLDLRSSGRESTNLTEVDANSPGSSDADVLPWPVTEFF
ncbi:hypothetical protein VNO77_42086 [Canavalia gladiata]|uniref:Uncharacterized protein n=1 Tax=Canavalia gladiata TaxID=3824 RepID=A0AAN9PSE7_CANGL